MGQDGTMDPATRRRLPAPRRDDPETVAPRPCAPVPASSGLPVCRAAQRGVRCKKRVIDMLQHGGLVRSEFCASHTCPGLRKGETKLCAHPKDGLDQVCVDHATCTMRVGGQRCRYALRNHNPRQYILCAELHNCKIDGCKQSRISEQGEDRSHCASHRCELSGCRAAKARGAAHCDAHTCTDEHCAALALAADGGTLDAEQRFCERHRRCGAALCRKFCHTCEDGSMTGFCGQHYCKWAGCDQQSQGGRHCRDHTCRERGCTKALTSVESLYCDMHECSAAACRSRKGSAGNLCADHRCAKRGCLMAISRSEHCEQHQFCRVVGCEKYRFIDGETLRDQCEDHFHRRCRSARCSERVPADGDFCEHHACQAPKCRSAHEASSHYCSGHKCGMASCSSMRRITALSGVSLLPSPYCGTHTCEHPSCADTTAAGTRLCEAHAQAHAQAQAQAQERTQTKAEANARLLAQAQVQTLDEPARVRQAAEVDNGTIRVLPVPVMGWPGLPQWEWPLTWIPPDQETAIPWPYRVNPGLYGAGAYGQWPNNWC